MPPAAFTWSRHSSNPRYCSSESTFIAPVFDTVIPIVMFWANAVVTNRVRRINRMRMSRFTVFTFAKRLCCQHVRRSAMTAYGGSLTQPMTEVTPSCDVAHNRRAKGTEQHRDLANFSELPSQLDGNTYDWPACRTVKDGNPGLPCVTKLNTRLPKLYRRIGVS